MSKKLIEIQNLKTYFHTEAGLAKAVDNISFDIFQGEILGIVGESGSGKSVTSLSINRLIPNPPGEIVDGKILFNNTNLLGLTYLLVALALASLYELFERPLERHEISWPQDKETIQSPDQK